MRRRLVSCQIAVILFGRFLSDFGRGFSLPFVPIYFEEEVGLSVSLIGLGYLANAAMSGVAVVAGAYLTDRFGRKTSLVASMLASSLVHALYPWARDPGSYLLVSTLAGAALSLYWPASFAMLTDLSTPENRATVFGWLRVAANAGVGLGALGGAATLAALEGCATDSFSPYHVLFYVDAGTYFVFFLVLWLLVRETLPPEARRSYGGFRRGWGETIRAPSVLALAAVNVCFILAFSLFLVGFSTFFKQYAGMSFVEISVVFGFNTALIVVLQMYVWSWVDRWRRTRALRVSALLFAGGLLTLNLCAVEAWSGFTVAIAAIVIFTLGEMLHGPAVTSLFSNLAPIHLRGTYMSLQSLCWSTGLGLGPVITGLFLDAESPYLWWSLLAGLLAGTAIVLGMIGRRLPESVDRP